MPLTDKWKSDKQVLIMVKFNKLAPWKKCCLMNKVDGIQEAGNKNKSIK